MNTVQFSIVIPVYNEEESLKELLQGISTQFSKLKAPYEIIFVDDGSTDASFDILKRLEKQYEQIRVFSFRRNLGKSNAMMLGFKEARGAFIVTLDADLQDDPKNIKALHEKMVKGNFDLVTGWRKNRKDNLYKRFTSKFFNGLVSFLFDMKVHDLNSGLKIFKKDLAKNIYIYGGMHRFIPVIANEMGFKVGEQEATHHPRKYGKSKYKMTKVFTDIPDLVTIYFITKYTRRPLHFFGKVGGFIFFIGAVSLLYLIILKINGASIGQRPLLLFGILFVLAGIQTIFTGLLADLFVHSGVKEDEYPIKYASEK